MRPIRTVVTLTCQKKEHLSQELQEAIDARNTDVGSTSEAQDKMIEQHNEEVQEEIEGKLEELGFELVEDDLEITYEDE